mgnify:FL=1
MLEFPFLLYYLEPSTSSTRNTILICNPTDCTDGNTKHIRKLLVCINISPTIISFTQFSLNLDFCQSREFSSYPLVFLLEFMDFLFIFALSSF